MLPPFRRELIAPAFSPGPQMRFSESLDTARSPPQIGMVNVLCCSGFPVALAYENPAKRLLHRPLESPTVYLLADAALLPVHAPSPCRSL